MKYSKENVGQEDNKINRWEKLTVVSCQVPGTVLCIIYFILLLTFEKEI